MKLVVIGGGLCGLMSALMLGRRGHEVTVVERDEAPSWDSPDAVFEHWARRGVPQARQPHIFLGRSVRVLRDEAPDVLDELLAAGAGRVPVDVGDGPDDAVVCSRRLTYEAVVRRAVSREPGVTVRGGVGVDDLVIDRTGVPVARGIHLDDGDVLTADLVVDASGRRSPTPRILARHGLRALPEVAQDCGFLYVSRHYRLHPGTDYPCSDYMVMASLGWAAAMAFPGDRGTFCLLAVVSAADPLRRDLATEEGFSRFHAATPLTAPWQNAGQPISDIRILARVDNRYRRLVDDNGPIVSGLVLLGDAAMHTNPTAGRGVSLAFAHAKHLASTIDGADSLTEFAMAFDGWTDANIGSWYQFQAGADASMVRRMEAAIRDEELPPPDRMEQMRAVVIELSKQPGPAAVPLRRLRHVISLPSEVLGEPIVQAAANQFLAGREQANAALAGPTRTSFIASAVRCKCGAGTGLRPDHREGT